MVHYGFVAENACPLAVATNDVVVTAIDITGGSHSEKGSSSADLPFILPRQRTGAAGMIFLGTPMEIKELHVEFTRSDEIQDGNYNGWPKEITVENIQITARTVDSRKTTIVTGTIRSNPQDSQLCSSWVYLILRDHTGKIVYGKKAVREGSVASFDLISLDINIDYSRTEIFPALGNPLWTCGK